VPENERKDAANECQRERDDLPSLSLSPIEGVPKAREGLDHVFKARIGSESSLPESMSSCLAGIPANPLDGQLLRFRKADSGYQFHSIGADLRKALGGNGDLVLTVAGSLQVSHPEGAQNQAASSPCKLSCKEQTTLGTYE
jgi:hypothetical protein